MKPQATLVYLKELRLDARRLAHASTMRDVVWPAQQKIIWIILTPSSA